MRGYNWDKRHNHTWNHAHVTAMMLLETFAHDMSILLFSIITKAGTWVLECTIHTVRSWNPWGPE